jgi:hypothetical protein
MMSETQRGEDENPHPSNAEADAACIKPLFPTAAIESGQGSSSLAHPNAQAFVNLATKHVFPGRPAPNADDASVPTEPPSRDTRPMKDTGRASGADEEQEPLVDGTPLDDMMALFDQPEEEPTPAKETPAMSLAQKPEERRQESGDTLRPLPGIQEPTPAPRQADSGDEASSENEEGDALPGFGAGHEMGSVSCHSDHLPRCRHFSP